MLSRDIHFQRYLDNLTEAQAFFLRRQGSPYLKPVAVFSEKTFSEISQILVKRSNPRIILDSCCGTGEGAFYLAGKFPEYEILALDKSEIRIARAKKQLKHRVKKTGQEPNRIHFFRADVVDLWRLFCRESLKISRHFLFYPNPYPSRDHFKRRWQGHPVLPYLLKTCSQLEIRSNFQEYLDEFSLAASFYRRKASRPKLILPHSPVSAFEKKYAAQGEHLYQIQI